MVFDNPSKEKVTVKMDDDEMINLEPEEINLEKENEYLINSLKEAYYLQRVKYFASPEAEKKYCQDHFVEESEIEGMKVVGDFKKN